MANLSGATLLVVDDDPHIREALQRSLSREPYRVISASSAEEALALLDKEVVDVILSDENMPGGLGGVEVLRQMKADPRKKKIPVVMLTTTDDPRDVTLCYDLGCSVYITKPVDPTKFMEAIHRLGLFVSVVSIPPENGPQA